MKRDNLTNNRINILRNNMFMLSIAFKQRPRRVICEFILQFFVNVESFYALLLIDFLVNGLEDGTKFEFLLLITGIGTSFWLLIKLGINLYTQKIKPLDNIVLIEKINMLLFKKAKEVDLSCYEDPIFYDNYTKANQEASVRVISVIDNIASIFTGFLVASFYLIKLISVDIISVFIVILPLLATTQMGRMLNKYEYTLNLENIPFVRKKQYVKRTIYLSKYAKELRLYDVFDVLKDIFMGAFLDICKNIRKYSVKIMLCRLLQRLLAGSIPTIIFLSYKTIQFVNNPFNIGDFTVIFYGVLSFSAAIEILLIQLNSFESNSFYIENLKKFLSYKPTIVNSECPLKTPEKIEHFELKNVSFHYSQSNTMILTNVNLKIHAGEKISIVGYNGAGKSTIVKLILRLYDPTSGEILLNGINIKSFELAAYRSLFGTVLQDFNMYSISIAKNVLMKEYQKSDDKILQDALKNSGILDYINTLKKGVHSTLTKEFDDSGELMSGGQYQKLALARVFASESKIFILDEPSSALDPISENMIWESIINFSKNKQVIFISHKLSASKLADKIYVIEDGTVKEFGKHDTLMSLKGTYFKLYATQAKNYN